MFGYIRSFKPYMRVCEFDTYKSVYCGLCKHMGKNYGFVYRFSLSYDFTFLTMLSMSINSENIIVNKERCIAHPLTKRYCAKCANGLEYPSAAAVISVYHKLRDDKTDKGFKRKLLAFVLLPFLKRGYKKAKKKYPHLASKVEENMIKQNEIESQKSKSLDLACEPTAAIMSVMAADMSCDKEKQKYLSRFGYNIGRYVYMCDALDDLESDFKSKNYNALLLQRETQSLEQEDIEYYRGIAKDSINMTLGDLAESYVSLGVEMYKPILDNIIYLGLNNTVEQIIKKKKEKENERSV